MPTKTTKSQGANNRFDRVLCGIRITRSSGTPDDKEFAVREKILLQLAQNQKKATLLAFQNKLLSIGDLINARDEGRLLNDALLMDIKLRKNLWEALDEAFPKAKRGTQANRYHVSTKTFAVKAANLLGAQATIKDLETLDWQALKASWDNSGSDWMHMRRMISHFLTRTTGKVHSDFRLAVMERIPTAQETKRTPEIDVDLFIQIADRTSDVIRPCYYVLYITGMRLSEYLSCTEANLNPRSFTIQVPGTKTDDAAGTITVDPELWHWIAAGIPSPRKEKAMRTQWKDACEALGVGAHSSWLHDLRHGAGQNASDHGAQTAHVQALLRHSSPAMTRRYEIRKGNKVAARAIGKAFKKSNQRRKTA